MKADELLTTGQAGQELNVPEATLRWWRHQGLGPKAFRLGPRKVMYKRSDLERWVEAQYSGGQASA